MKPRRRGPPYREAGLTVEDVSDIKAEADPRLTPTEFKVLQAIAAHIREHGTPPSMRELGVRCGFSHEAARHFIQILRIKGAITKDRYRARALRLVRDHAVVRLRGMS